MKKSFIVLLLLQTIALYPLHPILQKANNLAENPGNINELITTLLEAEDHKEEFSPEDHQTLQDLYTTAEKQLDEELKKAPKIAPLSVNRDSDAELRKTIQRDAENFAKKQHAQEVAAIKDAKKERPEYQRFAENFESHDATQELPIQTKHQILYEGTKKSDEELRDVNDEYEGEIQNLEQMHHNETLREYEDKDDDEDEELIQAHNEAESKREGWDLINHSDQDEWDFAE